MSVDVYLLTSLDVLGDAERPSLVNVTGRETIVLKTVVVTSVVLVVVTFTSFVVMFTDCAEL